MLVVKGTSVHAWLGWALCRGGGGQVRAADSCPAARRRLLHHVHRLPPFHPPVTTHILAIHFLGGCPTIKVSGWTVIQLSGWNQKCFRALLDWPYVQRRFPWGVAILFGGGFALAGDNHTVARTLSSTTKASFFSMIYKRWGWGVQTHFYFINNDRNLTKLTTYC